MENIYCSFEYPNAMSSLYYIIRHHIIIHPLKTVCVITVYLNGKLIRNKSLFMAMILCSYFVYMKSYFSSFSGSEYAVVIFILCYFKDSSTVCEKKYEKLFLFPFDINFNIILPRIV